MKRLCLGVLLLIAVGCATGSATGGAMAAQPAKYAVLTVVVTASGAPVSGAVVSVGGQTKTTPSNGTVAFSLVLRQTYNIAVYASGYQAWSQALWFQKKQTVSAALQSAVVIPARVYILPGTPVPQASP